MKDFTPLVTVIILVATQRFEVVLLHGFLIALMIYYLTKKSNNTALPEGIGAVWILVCIARLLWLSFWLYKSLANWNSLTSCVRHC